VAAALLLLGFGSFHEYAPWTLAHEYLPIFQSQHVPSRWHYPMLLVLAALMAACGERWLRRLTHRAGFEAALIVAAAAIAADIAIEARRPMQGGFWMELPETPRSSAVFEQYPRAPRELRYRRDDWAPPTVPAMLANVGVIECNTFPGLNPWAKNARGVIERLGAKGKGDAAYRGEAFLASGVGQARIREWTPNRVEVNVSGARAGDLLVLNQNHDPGWTANGQPVLNHADTVAAPLQQGAAVVVFRYRPRLWWPALALFAVSIAALVAVHVRVRGKRV
jgi:hypothetical protein